MCGDGGGNGGGDGGVVVVVVYSFLIKLSLPIFKLT